MSDGWWWARSVRPASLVEECSDSQLRWLDASEFAGMQLRRKADANKGNFGHVLVVAGSIGKTGAAVMAGSAALKAGAGLTTVATPDVCVPIVSAQLPELMTSPLSATALGTISLRCLEYSLVHRSSARQRRAGDGPGINDAIRDAGVRPRGGGETLRRRWCLMPMV